MQEEEAAGVNEEDFKILLERYDEDSATYSKILRTNSLAQPAAFLAQAQCAILERPVGRVSKFISGLAVGAGIIPIIVEMYSRDRALALALAKRISQCEPRFDTAVADYVTRPSAGAEPAPGEFEAVLDLLEAISEGGKLVPQALKLLRNPNPRIRSKAALFICSRTQNVAAAAPGFEIDGRVRANILESLFGVNSEFVQHLYRSHTADDNNRCRGNAVFGLYQIGDVSAIPLLYEMAKHPEARFRNTCAWVMGRTGDPRFLPVLAEMAADPDEIVRSQASKAIFEAERAISVNAARPQLNAAIARVESTERSRTIVVTVRDFAGKPVRGIPGTGFITRSGISRHCARQFSVEEYDCRTVLNIAFVLCLPVEQAAESEKRLLEAVSACVPLRRPKDRWGVVKLEGELASLEMQRTGAGEPRSEWSALALSRVNPLGPLNGFGHFHPCFEYASHPQAFVAMTEQPPLKFSEADLRSEAEGLVDRLLTVEIGSKPHIIFVGAPPPPSILANLASHSGALAVLHVISVGSREPGAAEKEHIHPHVISSRGVYFDVAMIELKDRCRALCASLLHNYRISSAEIDDPIAVQINAAAGHATAICGGQP